MVLMTSGGSTVMPPLVRAMESSHHTRRATGKPQGEADENRANMAEVLRPLTSLRERTLQRRTTQQSLLQVYPAPQRFVAPVGGNFRTSFGKNIAVFASKPCRKRQQTLSKMAENLPKNGEFSAVFGRFSYQFRQEPGGQWHCYEKDPLACHAERSEASVATVGWSPLMLRCRSASHVRGRFSKHTTDELRWNWQPTRRGCGEWLRPCRVFPRGR